MWAWLKLRGGRHGGDQVAFARDPGAAAYYEGRAYDFDDWYLGRGRFEAQDRPGWEREVDQLLDLVRGLAPARTLDVACGSGFLTRHLRGLTVGLDQSRAMVTLTQSRLTNGIAMIGDALDLPFADKSFDRIFAGHFYGHLPPDERAAFLSEPRRTADELIVIDAALRSGVEAEQVQVRTLNDGSTYRVFKRYLTGMQLAEELGGGRVLMDGQWFVAAATV